MAPQPRLAKAPPVHALPLAQAVARARYGHLLVTMVIRPTGMGRSAFWVRLAPVRRSRSRRAENRAVLELRWMLVAGRTTQECNGRLACRRHRRPSTPHGRCTPPCTPASNSQTAKHPRACERERARDQRLRLSATQQPPRRKLQLIDSRRVRSCLARQSIHCVSGGPLTSDPRAPFRELL